MELECIYTNLISLIDYPSVGSKPPTAAALEYIYIYIILK